MIVSLLNWSKATSPRIVVFVPVKLTQEVENRINAYTENGLKNVRRNHEIRFEK